MSVVTTVLITTSIMESVETQAGTDRHVALEHINDGLRGERAPIIEIISPVHQHAGGNKCAQANVYMGAINHLDLDQLLGLMRSAPWEEPEHVLLLVNTEYENGFEVLEWRTQL